MHLNSKITNGGTRNIPIKQPVTCFIFHSLPQKMVLTEWIRLIINILKLSLGYPFIWSNHGKTIKMVLTKYLQKTCIHLELMQLNEYLQRSPDHKPKNFSNYKWFTLNNPLINIYISFSVISFSPFLFPIHMEEVMHCGRCENNSDVIKVHILQANITSSEFK